MTNVLATARRSTTRLCIALTLIGGYCMALPSTPAAARAQRPKGLAGYFTCLRAQGGTIVSAHRGAPRPGVAENTIAAFAALTDKRHILGETDIHTTRDGVLMLSHDDSLDRVTSLSGSVWDHDWREIRAAKTRDAAGTITPLHPATLAELLTATRDGPVLQLDIKTGVKIDAVLSAVEAAHAQHRVIYLVYSDQDIAAIARRQPDAMISTVIPTMNDLQRLLGLGVRADHVQAMFFERDVNPAYFAALREKGVTVLVAAITAEWQAGSNHALAASRYAEIARSGAQILVSNFPDIVRAALPMNMQGRCGSPMGA